MTISTNAVKGSVPVTILRPDGRLDGQNYRELIAKAAELYEAGVRNILLDMTEVTYISSAGIVAMHSIARLLQGEPLPDLEKGWSTVKSKGRALETGMQAHFKLLKPRPEITSVLEMVGFTEFLESFEDQDTAISAFQA